MKSIKKTAVIVGIAVILLITYQITASRVGNAANDKSPHNLWEVGAEDIDEITIQYPEEKGEKLVFTKGQDTWKLTEPIGLKYNQALADGLPLSLAYLTSEKKVADEKADVSEFGLDTPISIKFKTTDGKMHELLIGNKTSTKESYYFRTGENNGIYTISAEKAESILLTAKTVRDKNVLDLQKEQRLKVLADEIKSLTVEKNGKTVLAVKRNENGEWEPSQNADLADKAADAVVRVLAVEFMEDHAKDLKKYGLKPPLYSIEFENKQGRKKLLIGEEKVKNEEFFAGVEGSDEVFSLSQKGFEFIKE